MKTKILITFVFLLGMLQIAAFAQNNDEGDKISKKELIEAEISLDPKLTPQELENLKEAVKGAPRDAVPVEPDPRALPHEIVPEGVNYLAPDNAMPVDEDEKAMQTHSFILNQENENVQQEAKGSATISQELPEKSVEVTNYRNITGPQEQAPGQQPTVPNSGYPKGNSEQPPGEKTPDRPGKQY
jgi:hypothetical protein